MIQKKVRSKLEVKNNELTMVINDLSQLIREKVKLVAKMEALELIEAIEKPLKLYEKLRLEFFKKHGKGDDKKGYTLPDDLKPELKKEIEDLGNKVNRFESGLNFEQIKYIESEYPFIWLMKLLKRK